MGVCSSSNNKNKHKESAQPAGQSLSSNVENKNANNKNQMTEKGIFVI